MNRLASIAIGTILTGLTLFLLWVFFGAVGADLGPRLADSALEQVPYSGVTNPVTAVLLNFRVYDTLLELAVLLVALLGIWSLGPADAGFQRAGSVLRGMVSWFVPLLILAGGYMLWVGAFAPGGAFQGGALLGAAGVLLRLSGHPNAGLPREPFLRIAIVLGLAAFVFVGLALLVFGEGFLTYPPDQAKTFILLIESCATVAIGAILAACYLGGRPGGEDQSQ